MARVVIAMNDVSLNDGRARGERMGRADVMRHFSGGMGRQGGVIRWGVG